MLDVKVLILFVMSRVNYPATSQQIYELCFQDDCVSYFDVCAAIPQMVKSGHLAEKEPDLYEITEKGIRNGEITNTLLFSNPHSTVRKNMAIQISRDGGVSWKPHVSVYEGHSAYSDMVVFNNGDVGIVYENGLENAYEKITFLRINRKRFK